MGRHGEQEFNLCLARLIFLAMPCRDGELFAQGPEQPNPVTSPRPLRNAWASHDQSNAKESAENDSKLDDEDDEDDAADEARDEPKRCSELNVYEQQPTTRCVTVLIPAGSALEVWLWTSVLNSLVGQ